MPSHTPKERKKNKPKPKPKPRPKKATVTPAKAKQILKEGSIGGKALTKKQQGLFGARAGESTVKAKLKKKR